MSTMFRRLAEIPIPIAGTIRDNVVQVTYSMRDHVQKAKKTLSKTILINDAGLVGSGNMQEVSPEIALSVVSPSGKLKAVLRESGNEDDKKRFVEIWRGDRLEISTEVTDKHGAFYSDDYLSTLSFSPTESAVVYTAEANPPGKDSSLLDRFRFTPSLGEGLPTRKRPTTFVYRWRDITDKDNILTTPSVIHISVSHPTTVFFGQAAFISDTELLATGYEYTADGRLLGIKGCFNRPVGIWRIVVPSTAADVLDAYSSATKLTPSDRSCRSLRRVVPDPQSPIDDVFWLSTTTGGVHAGCSTLHRYNSRTSEEPRVVLESVWEAKDGSFAGLYLDGLSQRPFLKAQGKTYLACHSMKRSRLTALLIDVDGRSVFELTPGELDSWAVLGTDGASRILCSRSSPSEPYGIIVLQLNAQNPFSQPTHHPVDHAVLPDDIGKALQTLHVSIVPIPGRYPTETVVYKGKDLGTTPPLITIPHGGPHYTPTTAFSASTIALALEGYTLSLPNYTGSLGFGEQYVQALRGNCGSLDVEDCMASVKHLVDLGIAKFGKGQQFVSGGSHGGFLAAHLIGQYPDVFSAAVLRNPVISCGELAISDIPDWAFSELGLPFAPDSLVTPEIYEHLYRASPIAHVDNVSAKVLLLIGGSDMRVPPPQAIRYYHALKGRSKEVEMLWFEKEGHPLEGVEATEVGWEVTKDWFKSARA
ncbi:alpha/beta-hydrolase [Pleurotus eryngii]|uniref:acylaminoacyl-peptidase n=1 Tax=Pleurotus eryngii TaxID=5323 RepID=A0A9P5ZUE4_PLEER|nr:alpha/beta-hydrolase [Pleurotus eryngii]